MALSVKYNTQQQIPRCGEILCGRIWLAHHVIAPWIDSKETDVQTGYLYSIKKGHQVKLSPKLCCVGWTICGGLLPQSPMANIWDSREDAELRVQTKFLPTNPRGLDETGNILQPPQHGTFQASFIGLIFDQLRFCIMVGLFSYIT